MAGRPCPERGSSARRTPSTRASSRVPLLRRPPRRILRRAVRGWAGRSWQTSRTVATETCESRELPVLTLRSHPKGGQLRTPVQSGGAGDFGVRPFHCPDHAYHAPPLVEHDAADAELSGRRPAGGVRFDGHEQPHGQERVRRSAARMYGRTNATPSPGSGSSRRRAVPWTRCGAVARQPGASARARRLISSGMVAWCFLG